MSAPWLNIKTLQIMPLPFFLWICREETHLYPVLCDWMSGGNHLSSYIMGGPSQEEEGKVKEETQKFR